MCDSARGVQNIGLTLPDADKDNFINCLSKYFNEKEHKGENKPLEDLS